MLKRDICIDYRLIQNFCDSNGGVIGFWVYSIRNLLEVCCKWYRLVRVIYVVLFLRGDRFLDEVSVGLTCKF
jgi:hypothetical protein